jgi:predicted metal-dependent peptidase
MNRVDDIKELKYTISMLALDFPFSMPFIRYDIIFLKDAERSTAAVDGVRFYVNKRYYDSLDRHERNALILHEWWHIAKLDCSKKRTGYRNPRIWNHACDFWINLTISKENNSCIKIPKGWLLDTSFEGMTSEQIYEEIVKLMEKRKKGSSSGSGCKAGQGNNPGSGNGIGGDEECEDDDPNRQRNTADKNKYADKNTSADMLNNELDSKGYFCDDMMSQPIDYDEDSVMKDVMTGLEFQKKSRGSLPGHLQMLMNYIKESKADWRQILASLFKQIKYFGGSRSFSNPKKWSWCYKIIDVSGSMLMDDTLARIAGEVSAIIPLSYECTVITADTEVKQKVKVKDLKEFVRKFNQSKGGGGTDFVPALKECEKIKSDITLFFTDGFGTFGDKPRIENLVWILTERGVKPPFGRYINID